MTLRDAIEHAVAEVSKQKDGWSGQAARLILQHFPANQAQDDTTAQLTRLIPLAEAAGLQDASDFLRMHLEISRKRSERRARRIENEAKGIPLTDQTDPDDRRGEHCAFEDCRVFTNMWTAIPTRTAGEQVAVCTDCAQKHAPCEVPTKRRWMERERLLHS